MLLAAHSPAHLPCNDLALAPWLSCQPTCISTFNDLILLCPGSSEP